MNNLWTRVQQGSLALATTLCLSQGAYAAGLLSPADGSLPALEIRQHHVAVVVQDGYAITTIDQTFHNPHSEAMEAVYTFPLPEQAAVGEFTYWIDGQPVTGEVLPKQQAREVYQQEKAQGRTAALTEQDSYRSFDSRVYPVQANDDVRIRLVYMQSAPADLGIGRYVYPLEEGGVDEHKMAFWTYQDTVTEAFSFKLRLRSSYPVDGLRLPRHPQASIVQHGPGDWEVSLDSRSAITADSAAGFDTDATDIELAPAAPAGAAPSPAIAAARLDTDVVVYWRHQQGLPGSIDMVTYRPEGSKRGTFMLTVTPGDDLGSITTGRDWVFVLDLSGSMGGKYQSLIEGVRQGLEKLNPEDRFRVVLFNNNAREVTPGYVAVNPANIGHYASILSGTKPTGGTNLYAGLQAGYAGLDSDRPSAVVLVTDGVANVGTTEKKDFLKLLEQHDVRLYSFVMGNSANRPLLDGMTRVSNGFAMSISNSDDIAGRLVQTANKLSHQAYRDIDLKIDGIRVSDLTPAHIGSLYRGQQLTLFGHYWGDGKARLRLTGKVAGDQRNYRSRLEFPAVSTAHPELERLWAFATIDDLQQQMDYLGPDADSEQAITDLAVEYGLVTDYTSLVVVREEVFKQLGIERNNARRVATEQSAREQRLQLPAQDNRQDTAQPAFSSPRAYPGGDAGGALGPFGVMLLLPLLWLARNTRATHSRQLP